MYYMYYICSDYKEYKGYIQIYRWCNTFFKFSIERGIIVVEDKIGVISYQLYVNFWWMI